MNDWRIAAVLLTLALFAGPACSQENADAGAGPAEEATETVGAVEESGETESTDEAAEEELSIMDMPLDGSSVESFKAGLALVDEQATEEQYRAVMSALDYLLLYDLSVRRNREKLYAKLDGQSPNQILETAKARSDRKKKK
jgi:hypothetical protein